MLRRVIQGGWRVKKKEEQPRGPLNFLKCKKEEQPSYSTLKGSWHAALAPSKDRACALYAADKSLDRQGLLSTNRREDTALVITTPRSSTRSFTDDLAPGLSTKDRAHWDRGLDPGPERQHARSCQGPKARSRTIDRTEHQVHRRFQAGF